LEREEDDIYPADLVDLKRWSALSSHRMRCDTYGDTIGNGERRIQDAVAANENLVERPNGGVCGRSA
jgi:hypothetical protein